MNFLANLSFYFTALVRRISGIFMVFDVMYEIEEAREEKQAR